MKLMDTVQDKKEVRYMSKAENSKKEKLKALKKAEKKMKKSKNHTAKKIAAGAGITVAVLLAAGYGAVGYYYQDKFYPGTRINGSDCGGMEVAEIKEIIKKSAEEYSLTIQEKDNQTEVITGDQIQITYQDDNSLEKVKEQQNSWLWPVQIFQEQEYEVKAENSYDQNLLNEAVNQLQCLQEGSGTPSQDARVEDNGAAYAIVPEVYGTQLDKEKTTAAIQKAVEERKTEISLEAEDCYIKPGVLQNDEKLKAEMDKLNQLTGAQVSVNFGSGQETISRDMLKSWLKKGEDGSYAFDESLVKPVVIGWSEKYNTYGKPRDFQTTGGSTVHLTGGDYGWRVWQDKTTESLMGVLNAGTGGVVDATWLQTGQKHGGNDIDGTYVEISISAQRMWFYKNGTCLVDTPVVTGNPNKGNGTPTGGVWRLKDKQSPSVLVGKRPDGSIEYKTPVTYWMPFNGGVGIHDLSTRSSFGGDIYLYNGSHGCINTPFDAVRTIYENIEVNTPIVVY